MTITFVTNFFHHHQWPVADHIYSMIGTNYHYIATAPVSDALVKGGFDPNQDRPYLIHAYRDEETMSRARKLIDESDVVIIGAAPIDWVLKRQSENKVTFHYTERWLKNNVWRFYMPTSLFNIWRYYGRFRRKRVYLLCASAYAASDVRRFGCFPNKCFKWGYFSPMNLEEDKNICDKSTTDIISIMWCARFLDWKHPELPVQLARRLKDKSYNIRIDMFGTGIEYEAVKSMCKDLEVDDIITFKGNVPNDEILNQMRQHDIFIFTSDRNEGWGVVLNEAMNNGCAVVASHEIGSVPYLLKDGVNGLIFQSNNLDSFEQKVTYLLDNRELVDQFGVAAMKTIRNEWSPKVAAERFLKLAESACADRLCEYDVIDGPASWA